MKTISKSLLLIAFLFIIVLKPYAQTITKTIGTGGDYATLNAAFTAIFTGALTGGDIVFEIISDITETSSSIIYGSGYSSANYSSLTIYPTGTARTITADFAGSVLDFSGSGSNINFDGRINQTGSGNNLTFTNTNAAGSVFRIYSYTGIDNVTIQYCNIIGDGNEVIRFYTDNNSDITNTVIDNCNIGSESSTATNGIWSYNSGTGMITATLSNCNIFNFWDVANSSKGLFLDTGSENWTISDNNFYQTAARTATAGNTHYGIYINAGDGHTVTNNYMGGSEAQCGGTAWAITGDYANKFIGIYLNVGSTTPASVDGNVISNYNHTCHSTTSATGIPGIWTGIYLAGGNADIGSVAGNTIGTTTTIDDIVINSTAAANVATYGIGVNASGATVDVSNNEIGGFTLNASSSTNGHSFTGIQNSASTEIIIENNTIGSTSVENNIISTNPNGSDTNEQNIRGIANDANTSFKVSNNTIANITNSAVKKGDIIGVYSNNGINNISENNISKLSCSPDINIYRSNIAGISLSSSLEGQYIAKNTIFDLSNNFPESYTKTTLSGIEFINGTGTIEQNIIYGIESTTQYTIGHGIYLPGGTVNVMNNSIRLGFGYSLNNPLLGILSWGGNRILGNSVYITGNPTEGADMFQTYAYCIQGSGTDELKNNNFVNNRTVQTYAQHYSIGMSSASSLESNQNNLYSLDTATIINYDIFEPYQFNTKSYSLTVWQTNSGNDANSMSVDPQFAGAEDAIPDLHISTASPVINKGTSVFPLTADIDDDIRDQQPDIGCDESYTGSVVVGAGETYETLKDAFDAINAGTITGNISINLTTSTTETATATLYESGYNGTADYTSISIGTVSENISVSGNIAAPIISFNGAHDVNMVEITVENQNSNGYCIQFINSANNNRIAGCTLSGDVQLADKGLVTFDIAGTGSGNDNNSIENCIFSNNIANYRYGILSMGTAVIGNNDNSITQSIFSNFWSNGSSSAGIYLDENNSNWEFIGNHLYQTEIITSTGGADHFGIYTLSSNNTSIQDNFIGGSAEECGGTAWTVNGSEANTFTGIYISGENINKSEISGNTIRNFNWTSAPAENMYEGKGVWTGIAYGGGIITISDNTIGAITGNDNIVVETTSAFHVASYGIAGGIDGSGVNISDNTIGSIDVSTSSVDYSHIFAGIQNDSATTVTITSNLIGSESTAKSINASTACTHTATGQHIAGIINNANTTTCIIDNNIIKNLFNSTVSDWSSYSGSPFGHTTMGIAVTDGINTISSNTIQNLSTSSIDVRAEVVRGISLLSDKEGQEISNNTISELSSTNNLDNSVLIGIWYDGPLTGTNLISNNRIYRILSAEYSGLASEIFGIYIYSDGIATRLENNMISLGTNETAGHYITGIYTTKNGYFYHNSVVIDGSVSGSLDANTFAFRISLATSSAIVKNNVFVNTRTNSGTGKNYAVSCPGTNVLDYNAYWVSGTGTVLGNDGTTDKTSLPIVAGQDVNSVNSEVTFTSPVDGNLHTATAAVNAAADPSVGISTDIDGNTRNPGYPDMGADEFTLPVIIDPGANLDFGSTDILLPTASKSYELTGIDLTGNMTVTAPQYFQVSLESNDNFAQSVSIPPVNSNVDTTIYARFLPNEEGLVFGDITNVGSGIEQTVYVQGSGRVIPPVMATGTVTDLTTETTTFNGEIVNTGGRNVTKRGFIYWVFDGVDKEISDPGVSTEFESGSYQEGVYSIAAAGLNINTHYNYRAHGNNGDFGTGGTGYGETADFWTLAYIPDAPALSNVTSDTINISINENLNPVSTEFAIHETTTNLYIQADGTMGSNPVWQTKADWGTTIVTLYHAQGRTGNRNYSFKTIARNGAEVETSYSLASDTITLANIPTPTWVGNPTLTTLDVATFSNANDYSGNSTGTLYAIKEANTEQFVQIDGTLSTDTIWNTKDDWGTITVTGLSNGTAYAFSSIATNDDGIRTEPGPATSLFTLATTPGQPSFTNITSTTADVVIKASTNPNDVEYAISLSSGKFVQADGTIGNNAAWQTKTLWDNTTINGLSPNTTNTFLVKARNGNDIETANSTGESIITLAATPLPPSLETNNSFSDKFEFFMTSEANPANTEYAVQDSISGLYVQADGSLAASPVWQAKSTWQSSTTYIVDLNTGTKYAIRVKARNDDNIETAWGIATKKSTMPNVPGAPVISDTTDSSVSVEISANGNPANITYAIFETNENMYVQADGSFAETEIWQTETEWGATTISNLGANQLISIQVKARNDDEAETLFSQITETYSLAKVPAEPDVELISATSVSIVVNTNENPTTVFYAIQEVTTGKYVNYYTGLADIEDWRTIEFWNNTNVGGLSQLTEYTFRVKARNSDYVETSYSQDTSVTTTLSLPPAPILVAPAKNAVNVQIPATFSWEEIEFANSYDIEYSKSSYFSADETRSVTEITDLSLEVNDLDHSYSYYWRVRATNEEGTGPWSDSWVFTTIAGPPIAPTLISPDSGAMDLVTSVEFNWDDVYQASGYRIQLSKDAGFSELFADSDISYSSTTIDNLDSETTYYWRVSAANSYGSGDWSEVWSFSTGAVKPDIPILLSPANDSTRAPINIGLSWETANLAEWYYIQVALDNEFQNLFHSDPEYYSVYYDLYGLSLNTTYYWRVKSINEWDESDWSEVRHFTTTTGTNVTTTPLADIIIYPNPVVNNLYLNGIDEPTVKVSILSETGVELIKKELTKNTISTKNLMPGTYLLRIETKHGIIMRKFIKQ